MYQVLSSIPMEPVDGHIDADFENRDGWSQDQLGATILPIMFGDEHHGPFMVLSYVEPSEEQMPLSFAHAHASDNWRISIRGTTNMGSDAYEQGQWRFHDGGKPYASDNFAWGPSGGYGAIMFGDRRGFAIKPVKASLAEKIGPQQQAAGEMLGIDMQDPCPGAPAIQTTMGSTSRAHLDGGFEQAADWDEVSTGVRASAGLLGEPVGGPVVLFVAAAAGGEVLPAHTIGTESLLVPVSGSIRSGRDELSPGAVRVEEADVEHAPLVAGSDGAHVVVIFGDRRGLQSALDEALFAGPIASFLTASLRDLGAKLTA